jgi:hypothetical protein
MWQVANGFDNAGLDLKCTSQPKGGRSAYTEVFTVLQKKFEIQCPPLNWITNNRISRLLLSAIFGPFIPEQYTKHVG